MPQNSEFYELNIFFDANVVLSFGEKKTQPWTDSSLGRRNDVGRTRGTKINVENLLLSVIKRVGQLLLDTWTYDLT